MPDYEQAYEQPGCGQYRQRVEPIETQMDGEHRPDPEDGEGNGSDSQFPQAAERIWLAV